VVAVVVFLGAVTVAVSAATRVIGGK